MHVCIHQACWEHILKSRAKFIKKKFSKWKNIFCELWTWPISIWIRVADNNNGIWRILVNTMEIRFSKKKLQMFQWSLNIQNEIAPITTTRTTIESVTMNDFMSNILLNKREKKSKNHNQFEFWKINWKKMWAMIIAMNAFDVDSFLFSTLMNFQKCAKSKSPLYRTFFFIASVLNFPSDLLLSRFFELNGSTVKWLPNLSFWCILCMIWSRSSTDEYTT